MSKPELAQWAKEDGTGRAYRHPFRTLGDGSPLTVPSVTTILGLVDKPALMQWAADKSIEWAVDNASLLFTKERESAIKSGRWRWKDVRDARAEVGTGVHETIESINTGGWKFPQLDEEQVQIMDQYKLFLQRYRITPHLSEFTVFGGLSDPSTAWAGTGDGLWDIEDLQTGEIWDGVFIDLKTSRNTWDEHHLQVSALAHADVRMVKTDSKAQPNSKGEWPEGSWIEEPIEQGHPTALIHLRADKWEFILEEDSQLLDLRYSQFMGYRTVWENKKAIEAFIKKRDKTKELGF